MTIFMLDHVRSVWCYSVHFSEERSVTEKPLRNKLNSGLVGFIHVILKRQVVKQVSSFNKLTYFYVFLGEAYILK